MILDLFPLLVVECAGFVQDVRVDCDLADVVQECGPTKSITIDLWQLHLLGDEVGVHPHSFTVAARTTIMDVERAGQYEDLFSGDDGRIAHPVILRLLYSSSEVPRTSRLARDGHSLRGLVGEDEGHLQQHGERQESSCQAVGGDQHDQGSAKHQDPPAHRLGRTVWWGQRASDNGCGDHRKGNGNQEGGRAHER
jgi:hypothetical protein